MKKKIIIILISFIANFAIATDQQPDILFYNNEKFRVDIGWGHPSPLETYYQQNNLNYPFEMLHTANYRGHIATWKIINGKFFITEIAIEEEKYLPEKFNVKSINNTFSDNTKVFADWFTGVLFCEKRKKEDSWKTDYSMYIYIKNGEVQKSEKITTTDYERIQNITEKDTSDTNLMNKYYILHLNQSYIGYYFRLHDKEIIEINGKKGYLTGKKDFSVILEKYKNSHFDWPYNWENFELNGAPNGTWKVIDDQLFITEVHLNKGLNFDGPERFPVELFKVFPNESENTTKVPASWANGIYVVTFGEEIPNKSMPEIKSFKENEYVIMRIEKGIIIEKHSFSSEFNFNQIPDNTDDSIKKILADLRNQRN
jgi:hypothetical protein